MPGKDGFAVIEKANELLPDVPKIIMTGYSDLDDAIRAVKLGAYDFLRKPLPKFNEFGLVIQRALQHGKLLRERDEHLQQIEQMNFQLSQVNESLEEEVERRTTDLRDANQKLRTLDEMKNNLLANISHELRTPLVSVRGYTVITSYSIHYTKLYDLQLVFSLNLLFWLLIRMVKNTGLIRVINMARLIRFWKTVITSYSIHYTKLYEDGEDYG